MTKENNTLADSVKDEIMALTHTLADAVVAERELEDNRHRVKLNVIERIMASGDNPLTGKAYSLSAAETATTSDPEYLEYLERLRAAARTRILARGAYDAALAAARLREAVYHVEQDPIS